MIYGYIILAYAVFGSACFGILIGIGLQMLFKKIKG